mmetsp:Transcript_23830/g.53762  ORF Transcript_23830/g.53762 Transcript_23830/m.53762 type:complete len:298 (-) Transcript_23830:605-1498(-)
MVGEREGPRVAATAPIEDTSTERDWTPKLACAELSNASDASTPVTASLRAAASPEPEPAASADSGVDASKLKAQLYASRLEARSSFPAGGRAAEVRGASQEAASFKSASARPVGATPASFEGVRGGQDSPRALSRALSPAARLGCAIVVTATAALKGGLEACSELAGCWSGGTVPEARDVTCTPVTEQVATPASEERIPPPTLHTVEATVDFSASTSAAVAAAAMPAMVIATVTVAVSSVVGSSVGTGEGAGLGTREGARVSETAKLPHVPVQSLVAVPTTPSTENDTSLSHFPPQA